MLDEISMTHVAARREGKSPFFFSHFNMGTIRKRGNTHYCFHCGGHYGFTPDKDGNPTNHMDSIVTLQKTDGEYVLVREALKDANLEPHITNSPGYPRRSPEDRGYEEWLTYQAHFDYNHDFAKRCEVNGYTIHRYNPMEGHDPVTHADAIIDGADKLQSVSDWLE